MNKYRILGDEIDTEEDLTHGNSESEQGGMVTTASRQHHQLPNLPNASSMDERVLEMENQRLMSRYDSKRGGWAVAY